MIKRKIARLASQHPEFSSSRKRTRQKQAYYTVVIPPAPPGLATKWHDPRQTLTRGAFKTKREADQWALKNIPGAPYTIREYARMASVAQMRKLKAAGPIPISKVGGRDAKLIENFVNKRMQVDWVTEPGRGLWKKYQEEDPEGFPFIYQRAKEQYELANNIIDDASKRIIKDIHKFKRSALPELHSLGFKVKIGKLNPLGTPGAYTYKQPVNVTDTLYSSNSTSLMLEWNFRGEVKVSDSGGWAEFWSTGYTAGATFSQIVVTLSQRAHTTKPRDWEDWKRWRGALMEFGTSKTGGDSQVLRTLGAMGQKLAQANRKQPGGVYAPSNKRVYGGEVYLIPVLAHYTKTANWWNVIYYRDEGDFWKIGVFGEDHLGGWSNLDYMLKNVNGRIKKSADTVVKAIKEAGIDVKGGSKVFGTIGKNAYIGFTYYGMKDESQDLGELIRSSGAKGYVREGGNF